MIWWKVADSTEILIHEEQGILAPNDAIPAHIRAWQLLTTLGLCEMALRFPIEGVGVISRGVVIVAVGPGRHILNVNAISAARRLKEDLGLAACFRITHRRSFFGICRVDKMELLAFDLPAGVSDAAFLVCLMSADHFEKSRGVNCVRPAEPGETHGCQNHKRHL